MKIDNTEIKVNLIQRLRRIEGQVRGVEQMLEQERDCREIIQQLSAIHSALQGASRVFLREYASACLTNIDESSGNTTGGLRDKRDQVIQDMLVLFGKAP